MSCPYCHRDEGHYLGCRSLNEKPGMYQSWWDVARVAAIGIGSMVLLLLVVRLIGRLLAGG